MTHEVSGEYIWTTATVDIRYETGDNINLFYGYGKWEDRHKHVTDSNPTMNSIYHGCKECYCYSMLFGGSFLDRILTTEEEFEVAKQEFVEHYNKEHRDLLMKKLENKPEPKKWEKSDDKYTLIVTDIPLTITSDNSIFSEVSLAQPVIVDECCYIENVRMSLNSRMGERPDRVTPNPRHMDRNSRFRARIAGNE